MRSEFEEPRYCKKLHIYRTMSRISSRSRPDKGQAMPAQPPPPSQDVDAVDIVPGRLTESEWLSMISQEEGEGFVVDILDEILNRVMDKVYEVHLKKQLPSYTKVWALNSIVQVINWQYLMRDEGDEANTILALQEDTEPSPSIIDSWAEGCVPVIKVAKPPQGLKFDAREAAPKHLPQKHSSQSSNKTETPIRKPRGERKRSGRAVKLIPATHTKNELEIKPHPPEIPSPSRLKPPKEYMTVPVHIG